MATKYSENINQCDDYIKNILNDSDEYMMHDKAKREIDPKKLDLSWMKIESLWIFEIPDDYSWKYIQKDLIEGNISKYSTYSSQLALCSNLTIHKNYKKFNILKEFILHVNKAKRIYIHELMRNKKFRYYHIYIKFYSQKSQ